MSRDRSRRSCSTSTRQSRGCVRALMKRCLSNVTRARRWAYSRPPSSPSNSETECSSRSSSSPRSTSRTSESISVVEPSRGRSSSLCVGLGVGLDAHARVSVGWVWLGLGEVGVGQRRTRHGEGPPAPVGADGLERLHGLLGPPLAVGREVQQPEDLDRPAQRRLEPVEEGAEGRDREQGGHHRVEALAQRRQLGPALGDELGERDRGREVGVGRADAVGQHVVGGVVEALAQVVDARPRGQERDVVGRARPGGGHPRHQLGLHLAQRLLELAVAGRVVGDDVLLQGRRHPRPLGEHPVEAVAHQPHRAAQLGPVGVAEEPVGQRVLEQVGQVLAQLGHQGVVAQQRERTLERPSLVRRRHQGVCAGQVVVDHLTGRTVLGPEGGEDLACGWSRSAPRPGRSRSAARRSATAAR